MKHTLLTLTITSLLATTAFADPIHDAAKTGDLAGVQAELDKGVDVDVDDSSWGSWGETPLQLAARYSHNEIVELLIDNGADVNVKGGNLGGMPLHHAAFEGHKEIVELLLAKGADVNAKGWDGRTPVDYAIRKEETADLLRKHGGKTGEELKAAGKYPSKSYRSAIPVQRLHRISQAVDLVYGTIRNKSFSHLYFSLRSD